MKFIETKHPVSGRGVPPDSFLTQLVLWARSAPEELFAVNDQDDDIYAFLRPLLGPWHGILHRRAAMMEAMRVHAGKESSWNQHEGVDKSNRTSMAHKEGEESGWFQVSFDSEYLEHAAMRPFAIAHGIDTTGTFIPAMKENPDLAFEYYARLSRVNIRWAGPLLRHEVDKDLRRESVSEFEQLLINRAEVA